MHRTLLRHLNWPMPIRLLKCLRDSGPLLSLPPFRSLAEPLSSCLFHLSTAFRPRPAARLYKRLGDTGRAQQQLELALSFKSGNVDASVIKAAIEKLGVGEDRDEDGL